VHVYRILKYVYYIWNHSLFGLVRYPKFKEKLKHAVSGTGLTLSSEKNYVSTCPVRTGQAVLKIGASQSST
jgi:hypothetical protein